MFKILVPAVAALGLVAFAAKTQPVVGDMADGTGSASIGWHVTHEGPMAKLAYGIADSDQMAMMMTCTPGDVTAAVYGEVRPAGVKAANPTEMDETQIPLRDAALHDLATKGFITVVAEDGAFRINATARERRAIADVLDYCGRKQA